MDDLTLALMEFDEALRTAKGQKRVEPLMRRLEQSMKKAFWEQGTRFIKKFRAALRSKFTEGFDGHVDFLTTPLKESITEADWILIWYEVAAGTEAMFSEPIEQAVQRALLTGAITSIAEFGMKISFTLDNPRAVTYLQNYGALRVAGIADETQKELRTILDDAISNGWSYDRAAEAITAKFEQFAVGSPLEHIDSRAHLVAVTEIGDAYCEGNMLVAQQLQAAGIEVEKSWSTVGDDKVSTTVCKPNEDAGWIGIDQAFPSGHQRPLGHPGCRCDLMTRVKDSDQ